MKCWLHRDRDAVAFCKFCGKGVCEFCLVVFGGDSYCKTCIESGRIVAVAPPSKPTVAEGMPEPRGMPSRAFFIVGGVGCIFNAIAAIWVFFPILVPVWSRLVWTIGYVLLILGLSLASVGYLGMRRNYGSGVGIASFAIAIVVSVLFLFWVIWEIVGYYPYYGVYWQLREYFIIMIFELFFAMMVLWGATNITTKRFTHKSGLSLATGIMLIITAVFLTISTTIWSVVIWSVVYWHYWGMLLDLANIFDLAWTLLFFVSEILATILFFMAKVPEPSAKPNYMTST